MNTARLIYARDQDNHHEAVILTAHTSPAQDILDDLAGPGSWFVSADLILTSAHLPEWPLNFPLEQPLRPA